VFIGVRLFALFAIVAEVQNTKPMVSQIYGVIQATLKEILPSEISFLCYLKVVYL